MRFFLFYFAVIGWTIALIVHILSLFDIDSTEKFPYLLLLHVGIFVVWLPAILKIKKNKVLEEYKKNNTIKRINPIPFFKVLSKNTPKILTTIAICSFFYAFINFILFFLSNPGQTTIIEGHYFLTNKGQIIKTLTQQQYHHYNALNVRGFSGHWMLFYSLAALILYPYQTISTSSQETNPY